MVDRDFEKAVESLLGRGMIKEVIDGNNIVYIIGDNYFKNPLFLNKMEKRVLSTIGAKYMVELLGDSLTLDEKYEKISKLGKIYKQIDKINAIDYVAGADEYVKMLVELDKE